MRIIIVVGMMNLVIAGCAMPPAPVNKPCGVIEDSLIDVQGKRKSDVQRIDRHYQRGRGAGCWK